MRRAKWPAETPSTRTVPAGMPTMRPVPAASWPTSSGTSVSVTCRRSIQSRLMNTAYPAEKPTINHSRIAVAIWSPRSNRAQSMPRRFLSVPMMNLPDSYPPSGYIVFRCYR